MIIFFFFFFPKRKKTALPIKMYYTVQRLQLDGKDNGDLLEKFGFKEKFIGLIWQCISTLSFTLLINDNISGRITPSKALRQGDQFPHTCSLSVEKFCQD